MPEMSGDGRSQCTGPSAAACRLSTLLGWKECLSGTRARPVEWPGVSCQLERQCSCCESSNFVFGFAKQNSLWKHQTLTWKARSGSEALPRSQKQVLFLLVWPWTSNKMQTRVRCGVCPWPSRWAGEGRERPAPSGGAQSGPLTGRP